MRAGVVELLMKDLALLLGTGFSMSELLFAVCGTEAVCECFECGLVHVISFQEMSPVDLRKCLSIGTFTLVYIIPY